MTGSSEIQLMRFPIKPFVAVSNVRYEAAINPIKMPITLVSRIVNFFMVRLYHEINDIIQV